MRRSATEDFRNGLIRAVAALGGDRAAEAASAVSKSVWYDAKSGRTVPDHRTSWPAMRAVLIGIPAAATGIRDWDELYRLVCAEIGRRLPRQRVPSTVEPEPRGPASMQLPPGTAPFAVRAAESRALDEVLLAGEGRSVPIAVIAGPPGVGKTALAVSWAYQALSQFADGVLYVDLCGWGPDRPMAAEEVLPAWLRVFGMDPAALPDDLASRATAWRTVLAHRQVLLVLDNARSEEQIRPLLPGSPSCAVLVTSRRDMRGLAVHHGSRTVELEPLSPVAATELLTEIAGAEIAENAGTLARLCGHLPLALRIVAESARGLSTAEIADLAAELDGEDRLNRLGSDDPRSDPRTVLSWSYSQLPAEARDILRLLGRLPGRSFDSSTVAAMAGIRPGRAAALIRTLTGAHLVRSEPAGRFGMHDLIRDYAAELADAEPDGEAMVRLLRYHLQVTRQADAWIAPHRYRLPLPDGDAVPVPAPFSDYGGALRWFDNECRTIVALCREMPGQPADTNLDPLRWRLAFHLKSYFFLSKRTHEWLQSHEAALAAAIRAGDRSGEAMTRNNLGLAWHERGDDDLALPHYQAAERLFTRLGDLHGVSNAIASQAVVHRRRGDLPQALSLNERALGFYREAAVTYPESRRYIAITLRSIALVETAAGRYGKAEQQLRESLTLCAELGMEMDLARTWNALGRALMLAGRLEDAGAAYKSAITAGEACGSRFEEAVARYGLGTVAAAAGDRALARSCWAVALDLFSTLGSAKAGQVSADLDALPDGHVS